MRAAGQLLLEAAGLEYIQKVSSTVALFVAPVASGSVVALLTVWLFLMFGKHIVSLERHEGWSGCFSFQMFQRAMASP